MEEGMEEEEEEDGKEEGPKWVGPFNIPICASPHLRGIAPIAGPLAQGVPRSKYC